MRYYNGQCYVANSRSNRHIDWQHHVTRHIDWQHHGTRHIDWQHHVTRHIDWQHHVTRHIDWQHHVTRHIDWQHHVTRHHVTRHKWICLCYVVHPDILLSRTNYQVIPSRGWAGFFEWYYNAYRKERHCQHTRKNNQKNIEQKLASF